MAGYNDEKIKEIEKIFNELEEPEFEIMAEAFPCIKKVTNKSGSSAVVVDVSSLAGLEAGSSLEKFIYGNIQALTQFVMCGSFEESQKCLLENPVLISDAAIDSMIIWCIDIKKISGSLGIIPHQIICLQCILKINQKINQDPRDGVLIFYEEIETNEEKYRDLVEKFLPALKKRVQLRVMEMYLDLKNSAEEIKYNVLEYVRQREYEKLQ